MTAPDELEPYTLSIQIVARAAAASPTGLITSLLDDLARRCEDAGCSVIGHIKCHASAMGRSFSCSLTSRRSRAACQGDDHWPLEPGQALDVDLAVLVYGLPRAAAEAAVRESLAACSVASSVDVLRIAEGGSHPHKH